MNIYRLTLSLAFGFAGLTAAHGETNVPFDNGVDVRPILEGLKTAAADMPAPPASAIPPASVPTFSGNSRWTKSSYGYFGALEQLGVMKSAEQNAVIKCLENGNISCAATASQITNCNNYSCEANATARALPSRKGTSVKGSSRWTQSSYKHFDALEQLGVLKSAEQNAVLKCQEQGLSDCAPIGSQITNCSNYSCEASALAVGF